MKKTILAVFLLLGILASFLFSACSITTGNLAPSKGLIDFKDKKIAVIDDTKKKDTGLAWTIVVAGSIIDDVGKIGENRMNTDLMGTGKFRLMERARLESILNEHKISLSGIMDQKSAALVGKLSGIDGIVFVDTNFQVTWIFPLILADGVMRAKLIDINSGEIIFSSTSDFTGFSVLPIVPVWMSPSKSMSDEISSDIEDYFENHKN